jgi:hypothetical protein
MDDGYLPPGMTEQNCAMKSEVPLLSSGTWGCFENANDSGSGITIGYRSVLVGSSSNLVSQILVVIPMAVSFFRLLWCLFQPCSQRHYLLVIYF